MVFSWFSDVTPLIYCNQYLVPRMVTRCSLVSVLASYSLFSNIFVWFVSSKRTMVPDIPATFQNQQKLCDAMMPSVWRVLETPFWSISGVTIINSLSPFDFQPFKRSPIGSPILSPIGEPIGERGTQRWCTEVCLQRFYNSHAVVATPLLYKTFLEVPTGPAKWFFEMQSRLWIILFQCSSEKCGYYS